MHIFATGASGFLGIHTCRALLDAGHHVSAGLRPGTDRKKLSSLAEDFPARFTTVLYEELDTLAGFDAVVHMATQYGRNEQRIELLMTANVEAPLDLLRKCLSAGVGIFVNTDTYYTLAGSGHPMEPYIQTKRLFIELASQLTARRKIRFFNVRMEHLYGPGDSNQKFCPFLVRACLQNMPRIPLTSGDQLRDFIFIKDAASAYASILAHAEDIAEGRTDFQVGCGHAVPLREFASTVREISQSSSVLGFGDIAKPEGEIPASVANIQPLRQLGWSCQTSLHHGIELLVRDLASKPSIVLPA